jgi:XTP/dITP diphosphohydrolase
MTFVLASNNKGKLEEMRAILSGFGYRVISQAEAGVTTEAEESGETFYDNALKKAAAAAEATGLPAIADDSGLIVEYLGGAPGVYSKRYGGEGLSDGDRNSIILKNMENAERRGAKFVSSIVCVFPDGGVVSAEGVCHGSILRAPRGTGGFGYDPVFFVSSLGKSMAELTTDEKNSVSHRGNALRIFVRRLQEYLAKTGEE